MATVLNVELEASKKPATTLIGKWARNTCTTFYCDGNSNSYDHLLQFLVHMVQKPEEKIGHHLYVAWWKGAVGCCLAENSWWVVGSQTRGVDVHSIALELRKSISGKQVRGHELQLLIAFN